MTDVPADETDRRPAGEPADPEPTTEVASGLGPPGEGRGAPKPPVVRYLGCRTTSEGREYSLRATDELETRLFVVLIAHEAFASWGARFQDGPDLCFAKLEHDLAVESDLPAGSRLVVTSRDLIEYRRQQARPASRKSKSRA